MGRLTYFDGGKWRMRIGDTEYSGEKVDRISAYEDILDGCDDIDRLRELVGADKDGRLILNPLKADDKVYIVLLGKVFPFEVTSAVWHSESPVYKAMHGLHLSFVFNQDDIGKTVFLTREAADAALAKETRP